MRAMLHLDASMSLASFLLCVIRRLLFLVLVFAIGLIPLMSVLHFLKFSDILSLIPFFFDLFVDVTHSGLVFSVLLSSSFDEG